MVNSMIALVSRLVKPFIANDTYLKMWVQSHFSKMHCNPLCFIHSGQVSKSKLCK
jgi:hypothetical protein